MGFLNKELLYSPFTDTVFSFLCGSQKRRFVHFSHTVVVFCHKQLFSCPDLLMCRVHDMPKHVQTCLKMFGPFLIVCLLKTCQNFFFGCLLAQNMSKLVLFVCSKHVKTVFNNRDCCLFVQNIPKPVLIVCLLKGCGQKV